MPKLIFAIHPRALPIRSVPRGENSRKLLAVLYLGY
jgi:hypothetical protein